MPKTFKDHAIAVNFEGVVSNIKKQWQTKFCTYPPVKKNYIKKEIDAPKIVTLHI